MAILEGMGINILSKVLEMLTKAAWEQSQKHYQVAKFLKKHKLLALKKDFGSIYLHALINYQKTVPLNGWIRLLGEPQTIEKYKEHFYDEELTEQNLVAFVQQELQTNASQKHNDVIALFYAQPTEDEIRKQLQVFKKEFDKIKKWTLQPAMLDMFNELLDNTFQTLQETQKIRVQLEEAKEAAYKKSFPYQAEQYLHHFIKEFERDYLAMEHGLSKYILVNGETRIYRETVRGAHFKKNSPAMENPNLQEGEHANEREQYEATPFQPINNFLNKWLQDETQNLLILVGGYGTGKTTLMRYLTYHLGRHYVGHGQATAPIQDATGRLPVFMPLRMFERKLPTFVGEVCRNYGIQDIDFSRFKEQARAGKLLIILDGFDEMIQHISPRTQRNYFGQIQRELLDKMPNSKVILTTRSEYFKSMAARERVFETAQHPNFDYVYVQPFGNEQVRRYLQAHGYGNDYWERIKEVLGEDNDVVSRPVLLEIIVNNIDAVLQRCATLNRALRASDLYEIFFAKEIDRKERELSSDQWWVEGKDRMKLLEMVALWMFQNNTLHFDIDDIGEELDFKSYFKTQNEREYEHCLHEFLTFTFLKPQDVAAGTFRISHKSFMEYLVARAFVEALDTPEAAEVWGKGKNFLSWEIKQLIRELAPNQEALLQLILEAKDLPDDQLWQGTNAANILLELNGDALVGQDLTGCQLSDVNFRIVNLKGVLFKNTNLSNCYFFENILEAALVEDCDFSGSSIDTRSAKIDNLHIFPLSSLTELNKFWIQNASVKNLSPLQSLILLKDLLIFNTPIIDLSPLSFLTQLKKLRVLNTPITDLSPLASLTQLKKLSVNGTPITDLSPLSFLTQLKELRVLNTPITDLSPLHSLTQLELLYLSENQVPDTQIKALQAALPNLRIVFR